ncbi:MAG TPA: hypothetical protein VFB62_09530, partial [Polyangiaceae bacterium]|nr:hypothetical protein [Polyangiaceae bacterium]
AANARLYDIDGKLLHALEHHGSVTDAAFSPDGALLATASADMGVRLWNQGSLVRLLKGHVHEVTSITWSASGLLASASLDGSLRLWSPEDETWCARSLGPLRALAWTREGLAVAGDKGLRLYDHDRALVAHDEVFVLSLLASSNHLAALTKDSAIVFDASTLERRWEVHARALCFGPEDQVAVADGAAIRICDATDGRTITTLEGHDGPVRALAWGAGCWLSGGDDAIARAWSASGTIVAELAHAHAVIAFADSGEHVLTVARGGSVSTFEPAKGPAPKPRRPAPAPALRMDAESRCDSAVFSPDGAKIAIATAEGVSIFDAESGRAVTRLDCGEATWGLRWNDRVLMARLQTKTTWRIWDARTLDLVLTLPGRVRHAVAAGDAVMGWDGNHVVAVNVATKQVLLDRPGQKWIATCRPSPTGAHAVIQSRELPAEIIDLADGRVVGQLGKLSAPCTAFAPDGELLATGSEKSLALWHVEAGTLVREIEIEGPPWTIAWSGDRIALSMRDGRVHLFDAALERVAVLEGEQERRGELRSAVFSPDGALLALEAQRCAARLVRAKDGSIVARLTGHATDFVRAIFASDDRIVSYSHVQPTDDFVLRLWNREGALLDVLAGQAGRSFSSVETAGPWLTSVVWGDQPRVWNTRDGSAFGVLAGHRGEVRSARYSPGASRLVTLDDAGVALVWDLTPPT